MEKFEKAFLSNRAGISILDFLADELPLSKTRLKDAMQKGAVWLVREGEEPCRVRRATDKVRLGDDVHIYYDESFLRIKSPELRLFADHGQYSLWLKPPGLMEEVSLYGDHLSLARLLERDLPHDRDCLFVDPEAAGITGLMLVAHSRVAASKLLEQQENARIARDYQVTVNGHFSAEPIHLPVAGREHVALTLDHYNRYGNKSTVTLHAASGLEGQVGELLAKAGFALAEEDGLVCCRIAFTCPVTGAAVEFSL